MQIEIASPEDKMAESGSSLLRLIQNNDMPKLDLLVRESIQNSLDAGDKKGKYVSVDFITGSTETDKIGRFFDEIQNTLKKKHGNKCDYIAIKDTNTVGLTGPVRKADIGEDGKYGNYLKLVTEISKPQDQYGAGGSWGLGKTVYFRIGIGLVVYYSRIRLNDGSFESRLSAALVENETKTDAVLPYSGKGLKRGIAWWGRKDRKDKTGRNTIPITDVAGIQRVLDAFGLKEFSGTTTGTMIIIPYIDRQALLDETCPSSFEEDYQIPYWCKSNIEDYIRIAIQRWYAPRLQNDCYNGQYLNAYVNGKKIAYEKMAPFFQLVQCLYNASPDNDMQFNGKSITSKGIEIRNVFARGSAQAGNINYLRVTSQDIKMSAPDNLPGPYSYINKLSSDTMYNDPIVLYTRKPGMVVTYETKGDWTDSIPKCEVGEYLVAIFVANSENPLAQADMTLEDYLRGSELADHKSWEDWAIAGKKTHIIYKIQSGVRRKLKDDFSVMSGGDEERKNLGLGKMLADMLLPPTDFSYWDDAHGGTAGPGGTGGDGSKKTQSGGAVNNTSHVILKQISAPVFKANEIELPVKILFGKRKTAQIEMVIDGEGKNISSTEWEKTFESEFPITLKGFTITSATRGKGRSRKVLIGGETDVTSNSTIGGIEFEFDKSILRGVQKTMIIRTDSADNYVIDGRIRYTLNDVQGTIVLKEDA